MRLVFKFLLTLTLLTFVLANENYEVENIVNNGSISEYEVKDVDTNQKQLYNDVEPVGNEQKQQKQDHEDKQHGEHETIPGAGLSIVFIFGGLLYSGILKAMCDKINIPINPLLLITGIVLGKYYDHLGVIGKSAELISSMNANGILAIFLPTLIFESAFKSEWYMLKKQFAQTMILGVPCLILASCLIMVGIKVLVGYEEDIYSWRQAFLLACTLCCTDIFSYVMKLKQYGAPRMLISLIQGESLFNYCTFVLIFQITNEVIVGSLQGTFFDIITLILSQILGGVLFGIIFGFIALFFLKRISYNGVLVVTIMVIFCYTIYMVMEFTVIEVSGIISLVTYGIFMGAFGKAHLVGEASAAMQSFWSYAVFIAETSIFLIAGVFVGVKLFREGQIVEGQNNEEFINSLHIVSLLQVYILVLISRYIAILVFQPWLSTLGYGMNWREGLVIAYGGLKGAIGISFAMIVFQNKKYEETARNFFLIHVTANSLLTLLINGMTTPFVINLLQLSKLTKIQYKFFKEYIQAFKDSIEQKKNDMIGQKYLNTVDWNEVNNKIGINQLNKLQADIDGILSKRNFKHASRFQKQQMYFLEQALQEFTNRNNQVQTMAQREFDQHSLKFQTVLQIRKRFIKSLKYKFWVYHEQHNTMPDAVMLLLQSVNVDLDIDTQAIQSWTWIKQQITSNIRFVSELRRTFILGAFAREYLFNYISYCYDVVSSYIQANQQTRRQFSELKFGGINGQAVKQILKQSQDNQKQAEDYLYNQLKPSFPEIEQEVVTRKASFNLLLSFRNIIDKYNESGQLEVSQYELLSNLISKKKMSLQLHNPNWQNVSFKQSLKEDKVFGLLPDKILTVLQEKLSNFDSYGSKQIIQTNSSLAKYIYFIRRGGCTIQLIKQNLSYKQSLVVGDIYGWQSLLSNTNRSSVITNTLMTIISVRKNYIQKIMDYFPEFQQAFWKQNLFWLMKMYSIDEEIPIFLSSLQKQELGDVFNEFTLMRIQEGLHIIEQDCILLRGSCIYEDEQQGGEKVQPLTFFLAQEREEIKIVQKSSFLVGKFPIIPQQQRLKINLNSISKRRRRQQKSSISSPYKMNMQEH